MRGVADQVQPMERLQVYLPPELRQRVQRACRLRRTKEAATIRWLLERALDKWEELPRDLKEDL